MDTCVMKAEVRTSWRVEENQPEGKLGSQERIAGEGNDSEQIIMMHIYEDAILKSITLHANSKINFKVQDLDIEN